MNGRAAEFFKASRELRQGCHLSPLLFVLQASVLSFNLDKKQQEHEIAGLFIARGATNISHALFTDDTILLGVASLRLAIKFKEVLDEYSKVSGSILNKGKCNIYCWNTPISTVNSIARCLGFIASISWSSFKYLGLPIFHRSALNKDWNPQLDKFKSKMQAWGASWLNIAGKPMLIKAVLRSYPLFKFSFLLALVGIIKRTEELIKHFF